MIFWFFRKRISAISDRKSSLRKNVKLPKCSPSGGYVFANLHFLRSDDFRAKITKIRFRKKKHKVKYVFFVKCLLGSRLNRVSVISPILLPSKCCLAVFGFVFQFKSTSVWNRNVASSVACSVEFSLSSNRVDLELSSMHMHWVHQVCLLSWFLIHAAFSDVWGPMLG